MADLKTTAAERAGHNTERVSPMKTLDELDRLHAAATAGEWADHADENVRWDDPMACGYDSREHHRGPPYYCTGPRCATVEGAEADASAIVALHNTWPSFSARLRAAEAALRALIACDDAISRGDEPPLSRSELAIAARAALGEP